MRFPRNSMLAALLATAVLGCDRGAAAPAARDARAAPSAREMEDGLDAVARLLEANRAREAEIVARKLLDASGGTESASPRVLVATAKALLSRSQTQDERLTRDERRALAAESAALAGRAASPADAAADTLRFAALAAGVAGDQPGALRLYARALEREPNDAKTVFLAAMVALAIDDLPRAGEFTARHAQLAPDDPWSAGLEARLALASGDAARAIERATVAVSRDRAGLEFKLILAGALVAGARGSDAARMLAALPDEDRARGAVAQALAEAHLASGDPRAAAAAWEPALRASPTDTAIRAQAIRAHLRAGDRARAEAELRILDSLDGGAEERARLEQSLRETPPPQR
jgi:tetratricopeptide (TPR) repeat protein